MTMYVRAFVVWNELLHSFDPEPSGIGNNNLLPEGVVNS